MTSYLSRQFQKYIIQKVVGGISIADSTPTSRHPYRIHKIELTDSIMAGIMAEGKRYGLDRDQILTHIRLASESIIFEPCRTVQLSPLDTLEPAIGERIDLHFDHEELGEQTLSLLAYGNGEFMVLDSTIGGLRYRDRVVAAHRRLNLTHQAYFRVWRGEEALARGEILFNPGKLTRVERCRQGIVFDVLDADRLLTYDPTQERSEDPDVTESFTTGFPALTIPPSWPQPFHRAGARAPFLISLLSNGREARLGVNPEFRFSIYPDRAQEQLDKFAHVCRIKGFMKTDSCIVTEKPGLLTLNNRLSIWQLAEIPVIHPLEVKPAPIS